MDRGAETGSKGRGFGGRGGAGGTGGIKIELE